MEQSEKVSRRDEDSVPLVQNKYSLLLSGLTFEPHSPVAGKAETRLSVMSQSQGTRECCGQRGLIGLQMQEEGRRSVDLSSGPFLCPRSHSVCPGDTGIVFFGAP